MCSQEELLRNYAACEEILISAAENSDEKTAAWRQQSLLTNQLVGELNPSMQLAVMRKQMRKLNPEVHNDFVKQRAKAVDTLLSGFRPPQSSNAPSSVSQEMPDFASLNEPPCHGFYESCIQWEVTETQLKNQRQKSEEGKVSLIATAVSNFNDSLRQQKVKQNEANANRNTITSFLQFAPKTSNDSKMRSSKGLHHQQQNEEQPETSLRNSTASTNNISSDFRTAREELIIQNAKKFGNGNSSAHNADTPLFNYGSSKKSLGARRTVRSNFVPPVRTEDANAGATTAFRSTPPSAPGTPTCTPPDVEILDERLVNIDPKMIELITNEIMHKNKSVDWSDIAGLDYAKSIIKEAVVYPLLRPDIFTGLRRPPRGILLFGPPGTGKTLIGKCIASKSNSTFFSISASSLTSKWIGDGEKMVRALFAVAAVHQPSVVFIDEIDSLLSQRSETEHESSRRLKTEFLVQLDGAATSDEDRILIVGATNRPQELDEAARRRLVRRLYIPLPEYEARKQILKNLLKTARHNLIQINIDEISKLTDGYSGADMESLCREASMEPIRSIPAEEIPFFSVEKVRPINMNDFITALHNVRPSVSQDDLKQYTEWNRIYGAGK